MIPNIIHQTWKTKNIPGKLKQLHDKVIQLHPGWDIRLWTDEENITLVEQHFPHLLEMYNSLEYNIMRADIIRYMYMLKYGGYYLDLDYEVFTPFDEQTSTPDLLLPISSKENEHIIIGNSIFGSVAGHVFWKDVLYDLHSNPPIKKFSNKFDVLKLTGPDFITRIYFTDSEKYKALLAEKQIYHPDNILTKTKNYQKVLQESGSRGIHHCQGSWLKEGNTLINLISRAKSSVKRRLSKLINGLI